MVWTRDIQVSNLTPLETQTLRKKDVQRFIGKIAAPEDVTLDVVTKVWSPKGDHATIRLSKTLHTAMLEFPYVIRGVVVLAHPENFVASFGGLMLAIENDPVGELHHEFSLYDEIFLSAQSCVTVQIP